MNIKLKDLIKYILYYSKIGKILRYIPRKVILFLRCNKCAKSIDKIESKPKGKIKIVFLIEYPEIWNSSRTVFENLNLNKNISEAYILALPKYPIIESNEAYIKLSKVYENVILGYEPYYKKFFDLEGFAPDYVFYTRPYVKEYPDSMKPDTVSKYAKLCYIPYGFDFTFGYHIEIQYNLKIMPYMHMIFCDSISSKSYCMQMFKRNERYNKIFDIGYPRFDLLYEIKCRKSKIDEIRTILWTPRWSIETLANDGSSYFDYIDLMLEYFSQYENLDLNLIIRPHPLMFDNFVKNGFMKRKDVEDIYKRVSTIKNISFDANSDYLVSACEADLIIADFTSLLIEYFVLDKPIIYCSKPKKFDAIGLAIYEGMYHISEFESIIKAIDKLRFYGDFLKRKRQKIIENISKGFDGQIGERIANAIIDDANIYHTYLKGFY